MDRKQLAAVQEREMADELADLVRNIMRGSASSDQHKLGTRALLNFGRFIKLYKEAAGLNPHRVFDEAIANLTVCSRDEDFDWVCVNAAQMGMRYLIERSCSDGAAKGRASTRLREFLDAIGDIEAVRSRMPDGQ